MAEPPLVCVQCGVSFKHPGRLSGSNQEAGYAVGHNGGRPRGTTQEAGFEVSESGGRPEGTTREAGFQVSESGGRPEGTTREAGCAVSKGRPEGTTREAGCAVSKGRPEGTTWEAGCAVSKGRPRGKQRGVPFHPDIDLPHMWEHSPPFVNVDEDLLKACSRRICQQRTYDKKPLGIAVCYRCGHMLWSCVDGAHTFLVSKPSGMSEDDAPASAYLRAVPNCSAGFVYTERGKSTKERSLTQYQCQKLLFAHVPQKFKLVSHHTKI